MIAALNRLPGISLPGPWIAIVNGGQCFVPGSLGKINLVLLARGPE